MGWKRFASSAASLLTTALLLECTARAYLFGAAGLDPVRVDSVRPIFQTDLLQPSDVPGIGFELRPNLDVWFKLVRLRTNSRGLRYRELAPLKPKGVFRAVVLGSSFTLPAGVALEDAFHAELERRFDPSGSGRIQFVNFAQGALHPAQSLAVLKHEAIDYDPNIALFCLTRMAANAALSRQPAYITVPEEPVHPFFSSFLWQLITVRIGWENRLPMRVAPLDDRKQDGPSVVESLGDFARHSGLPIVVVRLEFEEESESSVDLDLRRAVQQQGLRYVDTRAAFRGLDTRALWIHPLDPHPNARAHELFADVLEHYLVTNGLIAAAGL